MRRSTEDRNWTCWQRALGLTLLLRLAYSALGGIIALVQPVNWQLVQSNALTKTLIPPGHSLR
ncbi:MAG: hypothetical protein WA623_15175, partial [Candidatus Sulfotelmatobacter sp.]